MSEDLLYVICLIMKFFVFYQLLRSIENKFYFMTHFRFVGVLLEIWVRRLLKSFVFFLIDLFFKRNFLLKNGLNIFCYFIRIKSIISLSHDPNKAYNKLTSRHESNQNHITLRVAYK